ncbi:MAG: T9SS type A sorting domain-containing protein [Taibaiella sp.]|nr:T9SS type A sorting domain-containing protein [Taibaiella sp.]MBX9449328.1 T9SS type A sorting domain-containing protein [Taibaiella sp.]
MKKVKLYLYGISLVLLAGYSVSAQSPGGIPVDAWYKSDAMSTLFSDAGITTAGDNTSIYQWSDFSGSGYNLLQTGSSSRPVFSDETTLANFNPTVTFDGSNDWMQFTAPTGVNIIDRASGTIFVAGYMNTQKRSGFAGFHASMDYPGLHVFNGDYKMLFFTGGPGYQGLSTDPMTATTYFTAGTGWQNEEGTTASYAAATVSLNGNRIEYSDNELYNANLSEGARDFRIGADNNWGAFSGQLNEILVFEDRLTPAQLDQVETYLAIKYGTTYANGTEDYVNSSGVTVWDAATHSGFHYNIAGIARDDDGALYQKQSWSNNAGKQILIGIGGLANTNAGNSGTLDDGQFLIWGDNGLPKSLTVPISFFTGISHHFGAIWHVQNTGSVGTVRIAWPKGINNLSLVQSTDATIDASDITTNMSANEITINGIVYNYADVSLADGVYFTLAGKAVAPGGVADGLLMWHRADDAVTTPGKKDIWYDMSGNNRDITQYNDTAYRPALITDASYAADAKNYGFNFNPFYYFDGSNDFFYRAGSGDYFESDGSPGSTYGVIYNSESGGWRTAYGWGDDDPNLVRGNNNYYVTRNNGTAIGENVNAASLPAHIGGTAWKGGGINGVYMNIDGRVYSNNLTHIGTISIDEFSIGSEGWDLSGNGNEVFHGGISEVFAYSNDHQNSTGDEKQRINSYLAIKYGITLSNDDGTGAGDYLSSNSDTVWNVTDNEGFNNNIAGLAHDENSGLHQKQSRSNQEGQQVLIGTTGLANTNKENTTGISDGQFLIWGDNGLGKVPAVAISGITGINFRFASVWKVQNTGSVGTVRVSWPSGLTNITLLQSSDSTFSTGVAPTDMSANITTINGVVYNYADVILTDGQYFTFGTELNGPGGVALDLRVWLRSDAGFTPGQWTDFSGNTNNYTQTNASRQPFTADKMYNFNPIVDFGTTGSDARFMVVPDGQPYTADGLNSTIFVAAVNKEASGYTDIIGFGNTTTGTGLVNANAPTFTKLGDNIVIYPYITAPDLPEVQLNRLYLDDVSFTVGTSGIKYGKNGQLDTVAATFAAGNAQFASGSVLGAQPEVRNGYIGEVIAFERDLDEDEKQRVRSYVAIKYGITLSHDYIAANDVTVFWDTAVNTEFNNNIAGIARDDQGSLYQRQSNSINPGNQVLISTTGLNNSNAANTGALTNQQFLVWGDNGLAKAPSVPITGIADVNNRFAAIWKVQNTNAVGTVRVAWKAGYANLKLIQSADTIINSSDVVTGMDGTQTINGIEYAYADVTLTDGEYFTFAAFVQAPGGVTNGLSHWYRADKLTESSGDSTDLTSWTDFTSGVEVTQIGTAALPKFKSGNTTHFNFNPGIEFTANNQKIGNINEPTVSAVNFEVFSLTKQGMTGTRFFNIGMENTTFNGTNWDQPGLYANGNIARRNNTGGSAVIANPGSINFASGSPSIMYHHFLDLNMSKGLNGAPLGAVTTHTARGIVSGGHLFGANSGDVTGGDDAGFTGHIGELIIYGHDTITAAERNKIDAYLAIKYGVTLDTNVSYVTSQDDTVWNRIANIDYYYNVAGIGNDFISALHQKQSRSQHANTNGQVIIGLGDIAETNAENTNGLQDGQFLIWGDNGETDDLSDAFVAFEYAGSTDNGRRMTRVWKVQNTDVDQQVLIRFPQSSVGTTTLPDETCADYVIIFAPDTTFTTGLTVSPLTVNDSFYDAVHTFPNGMSYFTYARIRPLNPGVVYLPGSIEVTTEYDDECNTGEWTYYHLEGDATQKVIAMAGFPTVDLDSFGINITPEGAVYDDGVQTTRLMPRITSVADSNVSTIPSGKVRIYYSQEELDATLVSEALTSGWFRYSGTAEDVITDIYSDGVFDTLKAVSLIPDAYGIEDGVSYVEFHNVDSFSSFVYLSSTFNEGTVLDVSWLYFTAQARNKEALLTWGTASETANNGFEIERSSDGRSWNSIGFVATLAENGNSNAPLNYVFTDLTPLNGDNFYRLKQVDIDGRYEYSEVRMVRFGQQGHLTIVPNPTSGMVTISGFAKGNNQIVLVNALGQMLLHTTLKDQAEYRLDLSRFTAGVYYISVRNEDGTVSHHKVVKQ